jgi:hypothetical protein
MSNPTKNPTARKPTKMKIEYTDGTSRITSDDEETIINCLRADLGPQCVIAFGVVWANEKDADAEESPAAFIRNDDGTPNEDFCG